MPALITEAGTERYVSDAERQVLLRSLDQKEKTVYWAAHEQAAEIRLWDVIDRTYIGAAIPQATALLNLRMVVKKCSNCLYTSSYDGNVAAHVQMVRERMATHEGATILPLIQPGQPPAHTCSGCSAVFAARKNSAQRHVQTVKTDYANHIGVVQEVTMKRYALGPSEPVVLYTRQVASPLGITSALVEKQPAGAQASESGGEPHRRHRRRHRGRSRR